jgi:hypothetical protein
VQSSEGLREELSALSRELSSVKADQTNALGELRDVATEGAESRQALDTSQDLDALIDCKQLAIWQEIEVLGQYAVLSEARQGHLQEEVVQAQTQQLQFGKMLDVEMGMVSDRTNEMHAQYLMLNGELGHMAEELTAVAEMTTIKAISGPDDDLHFVSPRFGLVEDEGLEEAVQPHERVQRSQVVDDVELDGLRSISDMVRSHTAESVALQALESQAMASQASCPGGAQETDPAKLISRLNALRESMSKMEAREMIS